MKALRIVGTLLLGVVLSAGHAREAQAARIQVSGTVLDFDETDLIVSSDYDGSFFRIAPDGELFIRGREVALSKDQKSLLRRYYDQAGRLVEYTDQVRPVADSAHDEALRQHRMALEFARTHAREITRQSRVLVDSLASLHLEQYRLPDREQLRKQQAMVEALQLDADRLRAEALVASDLTLQVVRQQLDAARVMMDDLKQIQHQMWQSIPQLREFNWLQRD